MKDIDLVKEAMNAQKNSYSPYFKFPVGSALETKSGKIYYGCNVECASGTSNCAERTAIFSAIADGEKEFNKIAIVGGDLKDYCWPCGICRQVINEFNPEIEIISGKIVDGKIEIKKEKLSKLLPNAFGPKNLKN